MYSHSEMFYYYYGGAQMAYLSKQKWKSATQTKRSSSNEIIFNEAQNKIQTIFNGYALNHLLGARVIATTITAIATLF